MASRQQIIDKINNNPADFSPKEIANAIKSHEHEFVVADLYDLVKYPQSQIKQVRDLLADYEDTKFNQAKTAGLPSALWDYIKEFNRGDKVEEAKGILNALDEQRWKQISDSRVKSDFVQYMSDFPACQHIGECNEILNDFDWYLAEKDDTIEGYQNYLDNHPGVRDEDVKNKIKYYEETQIWKNCEIKGSAGYKEYLTQYPNGRYASEAKIRLSNVSQREKVIEDIKSNKYAASIIQNQVRDNKITWKDVEDVYGEDITEIIKKYKGAPNLPNSKIPEKLQGKGTEVYFWGVRGSGKTCALGTILSYVNKKGMYEPSNCEGATYRDALKSLFKFKESDSFYILPPATNEEQIHEMALSLTNPDTVKNPKNLKTPFTFIDLPGELIHRAYELQGKTKEAIEEIIAKDEASGDDHFKNFNTLLTYLKNQNRPKIHFFIFEYGSHNKTIEINGQDVEIPDDLQALMSVLSDLKVFSKSTVGIYLLMTKADQLQCEKKDRPEKAEEYFNEHFLSFKNNLEKICNESYIGDFCGITFSIGEVYAQQICKFDGADTEKLLRKLFFKSKPEKDGWLNKIIKSLKG